MPSIYQEEILSEHEQIDDMYNCDDEQDEGVSPREVGHNIYILCHQLAQHNKELAALLKPSELIASNLSSTPSSGTANPSNEISKTNAALQYYATHTAQIEVSILITSQFLRHTNEICVLIRLFIFIDRSK